MGCLGKSRMFPIFTNIKAKKIIFRIHDLESTFDSSRYYEIYIIDIILMPKEKRSATLTDRTEFILLNSKGSKISANRKMYP